MCVLYMFLGGGDQGILIGSDHVVAEVLDVVYPFVIDCLNLAIGLWKREDELVTDEEDWSDWREDYDPEFALRTLQQFVSVILYFSDASVKNEVFLALNHKAETHMPRSDEIFSFAEIFDHNFVKVYVSGETNSSPVMQFNTALRILGNHGYDWIQCSLYPRFTTVGPVTCIDAFDKCETTATVFINGEQSIGSWSWIFEYVNYFEQLYRTHIGFAHFAKMLKQEYGAEVRDLSEENHLQRLQSWELGVMDAALRDSSDRNNALLAHVGVPACRIFRSEQCCQAVSSIIRLGEFRPLYLGQARNVDVQKSSQVASAETVELYCHK